LVGANTQQFGLNDPIETDPTGYGQLVKQYRCHASHGRNGIGKVVEQANDLLMCQLVLSLSVPGMHNLQNSTPKCHSPAT
jgi:hypothetical protein